MLEITLVKDLIDEVFVPLNRAYLKKIYSDTSFHKIFGIYKIALLPLMNEKHYEEELKKILKIYSNKNLILDEETKNFFEMFLFLYLNWLRKKNNQGLIKLKKLLEIEKFLDINNFHNLTISIDDFKIVDVDELISNEGLDDDMLLDLRDLIGEYRYMSNDDTLINDVYAEQFLKIINNLSLFIKEYDELKYLDMLLSKISSYFKLDFDKLTNAQSEQLKNTVDEIVFFIEKWIKEVFFEKKIKDVTSLDALILSEMAKLEIIGIKGN